MYVKTITSLFVAFCIHAACMATDSLKVFSIEEFFNLVIKNHPVAKQADLLTQRARQDLRFARNGFDPTIYSRLYKKQYEGKNYYTLWDNYLTVPTWFGTSFKAGYENNEGTNLNRENILPAQGLSYLGLSVPLGQGLILDERRAALRQAQLLPRLAEADRIKLINKLLLQAAKDYYDWQLNYFKWQQNQKGYELAAFRFQATKERALAGDLAAIDTVEAELQMQNFDVYRSQSDMEYRNASLMLSNYLWKEDNTPLQLSNVIIPDTSEQISKSWNAQAKDSLIQFAIINHPELVKLEIKMRQLTIEKRYNANKLLPKLNIDYGLLQKGFYTQEGYGGMNYGFENYKLGATFSTPLFLRAERSKLQLTKIKLQENRYDLQQTNREIVNDIQAAYNEWIALEKMIAVQQKLVVNAETLRNGEQIRFENGESSLFLINSRELTLISNRIKLYELLAKFRKSVNTLTWTAGSMMF